MHSYAPESMLSPLSHRTEPNEAPLLKRLGNQAMNNENDDAWLTKTSKPFRRSSPYFPSGSNKIRVRRSDNNWDSYERTVHHNSSSTAHYNYNCGASHSNHPANLVGNSVAQDTTHYAARGLRSGPSHSYAYASACTSLKNSNPYETSLRSNNNSDDNNYDNNNNNSTITNRQDFPPNKYQRVDDHCNKENIYPEDLLPFRGACRANIKPSITIPDEIDGTKLNKLQRCVVANVLEGKSVFFSGPAGSGKSFILRSILYLNDNPDLISSKSEKKFRKKNIVLTATTGLAACAIGGTTVHSFSGAGVNYNNKEEMVKRVMKNDYVKKRWRETDVLVIDEVSMLPADFLDALEFVASRVRNCRLPFGGMSLVLCGDFYQLPPVSKSRGSAIGFAFQAKCWMKVIKVHVLLEEVFRQGGDPKLVEILNEARTGELSKENVDILKKHSSGNRGSHGEVLVKPTLLECRNSEVDRANTIEMTKLPGETFTYKAKDRTQNSFYKSMLKNFQAPETLYLKEGAQVILLKNIDSDAGLVNGSRGVVVDFKLPAQTSDIQKSWKKVKLPLVKFEVLRPGNEGEKYIEKLVEPEEWSNKVGDKTVCSRYQVPLRLAWCLSVHKSQGMTIPHLTVNLCNVFEYGQAYVALSRATTLKLLTLKGFNERSLRAHPTVKIFYHLLMMESKDDRSHKNVLSKVEDGNGCKVRSHKANEHRKISPVFLNCKSPKNISGHQIREASASLAFGPNSSSFKLSMEQKQRIEENKQRALQLRKKKMEERTNSGLSSVSSLSQNASAHSRIRKEREPGTYR